MRIKKQDSNIVLNISGKSVLLAKNNKLKHEDYSCLLYTSIDFNYKALKDFFEKQLLSSKNIRLSLIYPLSNSWQGPITDLLYLLSGRRAILEKDKLHILIDKRTKKELYLRLNSKKKSTDMNLYKKGDEVFYLNYKQYYFYGRIEKVSKEDVVLMSSGEVLRGKFPNIIKYYYG